MLIKKTYGIDLGSSTIKVYSFLRNKTYLEKNMIASKGRKIIAVGNEAYDMLSLIHIYRKDAVLSGIESRTSSPVRLVRDQKGLSNITGIYPCGEGAGYAGGITSAAMDGIKTAEWIASEYMMKL